MKIQKLNLDLIAISGLILMTACSSPSVNKQTYSAGTNPDQAIATVETRMSEERINHTDVLSPNNFEKAQANLNDSKKEWTKEHNAEKSLEKLGYAQGYLDAAVTVANNGRKDVPEVLKARSDALQAGARSNAAEQLKDADKDFRRKTDDLEKGKMSISAEDRSKLQKEYLDVELLAMKRTKLGDARKMIMMSKDIDAKKWAPQTLSTAEADYSAAETVIQTNRHDKASVDAAVSRSNASATKLSKVAKHANQIRGNNSELAALEAYNKDQTIARQDAAIASQNTELTAQERELAARNAEINATDKQNAAYRKRMSFNEALANAQKSFSKDEAEVYRQGDNLIIRLKDIKFPTNSAKIPDTTATSLVKVNEVIQSVNAEKVVVEGHTDSIGTKTRNQALSEKRAENVAQYLVNEGAVTSENVKAIGYGFDKPLTSNKTKNGRAMNRRVDIVIEPHSVQ